MILFELNGDEYIRILTLASHSVTIRFVLQYIICSECDSNCEREKRTTIIQKPKRDRLFMYEALQVNFPMVYSICRNFTTRNFLRNSLEHATHNRFSEASGESSLQSYLWALFDSSTKSNGIFKVMKWQKEQENMEKWLTVGYKPCNNYSEGK